MRQTALFALLLLTAAALHAEDRAGAIYKARCATCHGAAFELGSGDIRAVPDADLVKVTLDGKKQMPSFRGRLTEDEIRSVIVYVRAVRR